MKINYVSKGKQELAFGFSDAMRKASPQVIAETFTKTNP
jgi:hypothetical protein